MTAILKAVLGAAVISAASTLWAQTPAATAPAGPSSPAKKELVARLLKLQQPGLESMGRSLAEQPAAQLMQQAGSALQRVPAERREALARDIEADVRKYTEEAIPILQAKASKLAPLTLGLTLEERFSEDELRQLLVLLESPTFRKFQGMSSEMQRNFAAKMVEDSRPEIEPKVRTMEQSVSRRLAAALPAPAGSASRPNAPNAPAAPAAPANRP